MLIDFYVPPGSSGDFLLEVTYKQTQAAFPCVVAMASPTDVYCTGPQIPLGTTIGIAVHAAKGNAVLARGDFVLNALALPTLLIEGVSATPTATMIALTPVAATAATPSPTATAPTGTPGTAVATSRSPTPKPGTAYPNP
jgi:hypothetical protein